MIAPLLAAASRWRLEGHRHVPRRGGVLLASNHLSFADPIAVTLFTLTAGRVPRFFAKAELWELPVVRWVMSSGRHIAVHRGKASALHAFRDGVAAVRAGDCVVVFPEGGFTDREDGWPTRGKTGLARMALTTGTPVVPVACWGTQELLPVGGRLPKVRPRPTLHVVAGPPVELSDLVCERPSASQLREATERIMTSITDLLVDVRGRTPPADAVGA
ncbi:lysophospholipid acyltransferase family protein [Saccharomonospora cyanea]|uniref:1-acyl-sn-glycerol-3-phosphate acyltransferase n=1 Tax=Saccharomonospora cyanea NA-134 TaxID=882082 RepID=H5XCJ4_9PSEU|nr:1-acyl-sn-glycerol-3-phosphate acyltransferase [Saccharomonospora cyanea NA-134]